MTEKEDQQQRRAGEAGASLSEQLLLQCLNGQSLIEQRIVRTEGQNEAILAWLKRADRRQDAAEVSRGKLHERVNEISVNVAAVEVHVEAQGERLDALDPIVAGLKDASIEGRAIRKVVATVLRNGYVRAGGAAIVAGGTGWHQWETLRSFTARLIGVKLGGGS